MKQKKSNNQKELFTLCVQVSEEDGKTSVNLSCMKDGKESGLHLIDGENLELCCNALGYAASIFAHLWAKHLHSTGEMSDEQFNELMGKANSSKESD